MLCTWWISRDSPDSPEGGVTLSSTVAFDKRLRMEGTALPTDGKCQRPRVWLFSAARRPQWLCCFQGITSTIQGIMGSWLWRGTGSGAAQYASRNRSVMAHSMDLRRAVSCTRAHGQILAIMHVPETPGGMEGPC